MPGKQSYTEKELLLRIAEGDELAFGVMFSTYYPQVHSLVNRFSLHEEDVRDALQETFINLWLKREQLADVNDLRAWLLRIAARKCRDVFSKSLVKLRTENMFSQNAESGSLHTPAETMQASEVRRLVNQAIKLMPEQRKRIYLLSREEGLKPAEIAERLSLSVSTVKNTLVTALRDIRVYLSEAGYTLPVIFLLFFYFD